MFIPKTRINLMWDGLEWGNDRYIYWWNLLPPELRQWGYTEDWWDGPRPTLWWWYGNITWKFR